jgi:hypothetical protein
MLSAESRSLARGVDIKREHHSGNLPAQPPQKALHRVADGTNVVKQQHDRLAVGCPPQTRTCRPSRCAVCHDMGQGLLQCARNVIQRPRLV